MAHIESELCVDVGIDACRSACPPIAPRDAHVECLLAFRLGEDPEALALARALWADRRTVVGIDPRASIDGYGGAPVDLVPALPVGEDRRHLTWIRQSLDRVETFLAAIEQRSTAPVSFRAQPRVFRFFRTRQPSYPSAYGAQGVVGYNLAGPLFTDPDSTHETLFHELFHLEDERHGSWSIRTLTPVFTRIVELCGDDHDCLTPYAPHDTRVPGGTYYPFDARTRDVREYAAELALRYYREHEVYLSGAAPETTPFKCATDANRIAWTHLADTFFGGVDLAPECSGEEG